MSAIKTKALAGIFGVMAALPATAMDELHRMFAECAGRYSAEIEHSWLMMDGRADDLAHKKQAFVTLAQATAPSQTRDPALSYRIKVKAAHASLLQQATFAPDPVRSKAATKLAAIHVQSCANMLLDS